ncbi:MAG: Rrf2 family transcriptional regulator [Planctomycetaceae bacterium]|nr:Rrf2 family transcriptional regulator [Planctomycetaceae bacterium]
MKISMKTDYAFRVLFTLVEHYGKEPIPIRELAQRNDVPKRFLEHIMLEMKAKGWVCSEMGKQGGYRLAKSPEQITAGEVIRHFDGVLAPIGCVSVFGYEPCDKEPKCRFRRLFLDVRNHAARLMDRTTLSAIFAEKSVETDEVLSMEFVNGAGI